MASALSAAVAISASGAGSGAGSDCIGGAAFEGSVHHAVRGASAHSIPVSLQYQQALEPARAVGNVAGEWEGAAFGGGPVSDVGRTTPSPCAVRGLRGNHLPMKVGGAPRAIPNAPCSLDAIGVVGEFAEEPSFMATLRGIMRRSAPKTRTCQKRLRDNVM